MVGQITYEKASGILLSKYKDSEILSAYESPTKFVFAIQPRGNKKELLDNTFYVDKKTGKLKEYSFMFDLKEWKEMQNHPVFRKK